MLNDENVEQPGYLERSISAPPLSPYEGFQVHIYIVYNIYCDLCDRIFYMAEFLHDLVPEFRRLRRVRQMFRLCWNHTTTRIFWKDLAA